ncbi:hypothetical protein [Microbulbifer sp. TYP-18]|uniref:hypothetical protein n=1 Tax=Microbulbifer sp. TYP-18 TaxID=3230024 RepID=UPI0034C60E3C
MQLNGVHLNHCGVNTMIKECIILLFFLSMSIHLWADEPRSSNMNIWTENDDVYVLHTHSVTAWTIRKSELKVIDKKNGSEIFRAETTPFTKLVPVDGGKYFAGFSDLQAGSLPHGYNFALFTPDGEFISRVYVSKKTGHCDKVSQSVSQYLRWFSKSPNIKLAKDENGSIKSIIVSPLYYESSPCKLPIGDQLVKLEK